MGAVGRNEALAGTSGVSVGGNGVPAGTRLMVSASRVYAIGTTATNILAEY